MAGTSQKTAMIFCVLLLLTTAQPAYAGWDILWYVGGAGAAIVGAPFLLGAAGFGAGGIAAGSLGAKFMSAAWASQAAAGVGAGIKVAMVSTLQSAGAAGLTAAQTALVGGVGAAAGQAANGMLNDKDKGNCNKK